MPLHGALVNSRPGDTRRQAVTGTFPFLKLPKTSLRPSCRRERNVVLQSLLTGGAKSDRNDYKGNVRETNDVIANLHLMVCRYVGEYAVKATRAERWCQCIWHRMCIEVCLLWGGGGKGAACVLTVVGANEDARIEPHRVDMEVCLAVAPERGRKKERTGKN